MKTTVQDCARSTIADTIRQRVTSLAARRPTGAKTVGSYLVRSLAVGAFATGALAVGSLVIGRLGIGRLAVRQSRIRRLQIDELEIGKYRLPEPLPVHQNGQSVAASEPAVHA